MVYRRGISFRLEGAHTRLKTNGHAAIYQQWLYLKRKLEGGVTDKAVPLRVLPLTDHIKEVREMLVKAAGKKNKKGIGKGQKSRKQGASEGQRKGKREGGEKGGKTSKRIKSAKTVSPSDDDSD